ncbi:hypothetical protein L1049_006319 [Liquidambar formosana]|uniref:NAD(P)H dehydrogenase subunit CRR3, chloroplastic n=1 Tax=Liquidambar formosana TaxID=63359 RepID=A0AAP0RH04_LIQFO
MNCLSITRTLALASLPNNSPPPQPNRTPPMRRISSTPTPPRRTPIPQQQQQQKQPSVVEIERAIGAGIFRDRNPRESEVNKTLFDVLLSSSIGKSEGPVEKRLRETGEWILDRSEGASRSAGKQILMGMFLWIIPLGISLLVASGFIKLPFSTPFLDDLIM